MTFARLISIVLRYLWNPCADMKASALVMRCARMCSSPQITNCRYITEDFRAYGAPDICVTVVLVDRGPQPRLPSDSPAYYPKDTDTKDD